MDYETLRQRYGNLTDLFTLFLNYDWPDHGSASLAVAAYVADPYTKPSTAQRELRLLRAEYGDTPAMMELLDTIGNNYGTDTPEEITAFLDMIERVLVDPGSATPDIRSFSRLKASTFYDEDTANAAATAVARAHEAAVRAFFDAPEPPTLVMDHYLDAPAGDIALAGGGEVAGRTAVVVMHRHDGHPYIYVAYLNTAEPGPDGALASRHHPALFHLVAGYLNEDWDEDHGSVEEVLDAYTSTEPATRIQAAYDELQALRRQHGDTGELMAVLSDLGNAIPAGDGHRRTVTDYLDTIETHLRDALADPVPGG